MLLSPAHIGIVIAILVLFITVVHVWYAETHPIERFWRWRTLRGNKMVILLAALLAAMFFIAFTFLPG